MAHCANMGFFIRSHWRSSPRWQRTIRTFLCAINSAPLVAHHAPAAARGGAAARPPLRGGGVAVPRGRTEEGRGAQSRLLLLSRIIIGGLPRPTRRRVVVRDGRDLVRRLLRGRRRDAPAGARLLLALPPSTSPPTTWQDRLVSRCWTWNAPRGRFLAQVSSKSKRC